MVSWVKQSHLPTIEPQNAEYIKFFDRHRNRLAEKATKEHFAAIGYNKSCHASFAFILYSALCAPFHSGLGCAGMKCIQSVNVEQVHRVSRALLKDNYLKDD